MIRMVWAATALICMCTSSALGAPRNVVLFVADDLGREAVGCYGNKVVQTPGIDALAKAGTRLTNAFCTTASCSASRSVILTGLQNHANGQFGHQPAPHHFSSFDTVQSLPRRLQDAGYRTIRAGKFHVGPESVYPFQQVIEVDRPLVMAEAAKKLIEADSATPFFLYFCTTEPHRPFAHGDFAVPKPEDVAVPPWLPDRPEVREELALFYASIQQMDSGVQALLEMLLATGHWDDTLVVFVSDNGAPFPGAKTTHYEPGVNLPCVIRNPGAANHGGTCDALATWCDITPTILDYAGVKAEAAAFHGRSLLPVLATPHPEGWDEAFLSHTFHEITMYYPMRTLRERRYKLIWNIAHELPFPFGSDLYISPTWKGQMKQMDAPYGQRSADAYIHRPEFELYDIEADAGELYNLADDPSQADTLARMKTRLRELEHATADPWELKWDRE